MQRKNNELELEERSVTNKEENKMEAVSEMQIGPEGKEKERD